MKGPGCFPTFLGTGLDSLLVDGALRFHLSQTPHLLEQFAGHRIPGPRQALQEVPKDSVSVGNIQERQVCEDLLLEERIQKICGDKSPQVIGAEGSDSCRVEW